MTRDLILRVFLVIGSLAVCASADNWPTYRHDNQRSGVSAERIMTPLTEKWVFTAKGSRRLAVDGFPQSHRNSIHLKDFIHILGDFAVSQVR